MFTATARMGLCGIHGEAPEALLHCCAQMDMSAGWVVVHFRPN